MRFKVLLFCSAIVEDEFEAVADDDDDDDDDDVANFCVVVKAAVEEVPLFANDDDDDFLVSAFLSVDTAVVFSVVVDVLELCCEVLELGFEPKFKDLILGMAPVVLVEAVEFASLFPLAFGFISGPAEAARDSRSLEAVLVIAKKDRDKI